MTKLPFSLIATVRPLAKDPSYYRDPYQELQDILLRSYGLSVAQMMSKWLDYPMCGNTSVPRRLFFATQQRIAITWKLK